MLTHEQVIRIQVEVMSGQSWKKHTAEIPDTSEAHEMWDGIAADITQAEAKGWVVEVPREFPI